MAAERRPLARLHKLHDRGKRAISQRHSHRANLRRELRDTSRRPDPDFDPKGPGDPDAK